MKTRSATFLTFTLLVTAAAVSTVAFADAGVFTGNGQNLHQISSKKVQLVSIDVTIVPARGRFLFDGTVPGMDQIGFDCRFVLKSLSDKEEKVQIGFPVDSQFARSDRNRSPAISAKESHEWVSEYSFMARDEKRTYDVEFVRRKPQKGSGEFSELFTWNMSFSPRETRTLTVQYRMPMTMGLTSTRKNENLDYALDEPIEQELLNIAMEEVVGYITSTGSSWAGRVDTATFTIITRPFERYLDVRGVGEEPPTEDNAKQDEETIRYRKAFPVRHPWWFRKLSPDGWTKVDNGIQWRYKDYKPQDPLVVSYFMTEFPRRPEEASSFVDQFLENASDTATAVASRQRLKQALATNTDKGPEPGPARQRVVELQRLKQLLLATWGKEPEDELVKRHVAGQLWYEPDKEFSIDKLDAGRKAILDQIDVRIEKEKGTQSLPRN